MSIHSNLVDTPAARGIEYRGGPYFSIQGNRVLEANDFGIIVSASSQRAGRGLVLGNHVVGGCSSEGLRVSNFDDVIVAHNAVWDIDSTVAINASGSGDRRRIGPTVYDSPDEDIVGGWTKTTAGIRTLAANAAIAFTPYDRTVYLQSTNTSSIGATMTTSGMTPGTRIRVVLIVRSSSGAYTIAGTRWGTAGTVTLDAAGEGVDLCFDGSVWQIEQLLNGAGFA
jgi:hypothetical protein